MNPVFEIQHTYRAKNPDDLAADRGELIDIIEKKRDGHALTEEEIEFFINGYTKGDIPDYQASAF